jgi:hypothetical protein
VSDRGGWAHTTLAKLEAEIGAWPERKNDAVFQKALKDIADDPAVAEIAAQFGDKIRLNPHFVAHARRDAAEEALGRMMHAVAQAMANPHLEMVPAGEIVRKREEFERAEAKALGVVEARRKLEERARTAVLFTEREKFKAQIARLPPAHVVEEYLSGIALFKAIQAPLDDPIVKRGANARKGSNVSTEDYDRAQAVRARVRAEARYLFGAAGDRVADVFAYAATGVDLARPRPRFKR